MSAFVTVALDAAPDEVRVDSWETTRGPDVQVVATHAAPATLRAAAQALLDLAEWREDVLAAQTGVAA